jgi:hypothetical protein
MLVIQNLKYKKAIPSSGSLFFPKDGIEQNKDFPASL